MVIIFVFAECVFYCKNGACLLTNSEKCDGHNHCNDYSDEDPELCGMYSPKILIIMQVKYRPSMKMLHSPVSNFALKKQK